MCGGGCWRVPESLYFSCGSDLKWLYSEGTACLLGLLLPLSRQTKHHSERRRFKTGRFYAILASGFIVHRHLPHACLALQPFRMLKRTGKQKATGMLPPRVTLDTAPALPVAALSNTRPMPYNPSIRKYTFHLLAENCECHSDYRLSIRPSAHGTSRPVLFGRSLVSVSGVAHDREKIPIKSSRPMRLTSSTGEFGCIYLHDLPLFSNQPVQGMCQMH